MMRQKQRRGLRRFSQHLARRRAAKNWRLNPKDSELSAGFTIVEMVIATTVFSVVMLVAMSGFIEIGRLFYKGAVSTANQEAARDITDTIKSDIATTTDVSEIGKVTSKTAANGGKIRYYCVGNNRYTFALGNPVDSANHNLTDNFGLVTDTLSGSSGCANPFDSPDSVPIAANGRELLGERMRLNYLCISQNSQVNYGLLYDVNISIVTGNDAYLTNGDTSTEECSASQQLSCNSALKTAQYCARTDLSTSVAAYSPTINIGTDSSGAP